LCFTSQMLEYIYKPDGYFNFVYPEHNINNFIRAFVKIILSINR
jgi:hypothetical protein